jgi:predicted ABC-type ATPase
MRAKRGRIVVAAGTNGAGKSTIAGEYLAATGGAYFNPDIVAQRLVAGGMPRTEANAAAWTFGFEGLRRAIDHRQDFVFETTLGGRSIVRELHRAIESGAEVLVFYVGLASPELHIARVRARVARGGHDIPTAKIRERYPQSLSNLIGLLGKAAAVHVFDNSTEDAYGRPSAALVFRMLGRKIIEPDTPTLLDTAPEWAHPVVAAALKIHSAPTPLRRKRPNK